MNRAAHRVQIFSSGGDYRYFLAVLRKFTGQLGLDVAAYCIMPNHYHVLVKGKGELLTPCFHEVDRLYAARWNERRKGKGHVFQGPFLSFHQRTSGWAVRTSAYIHLNPIGRAFPRSEDYPWSSYSKYLHAGSASSWVKPEIILTILQPDLVEARQIYADLVEVRIPWNPVVGRLAEEKRFGWILAIELAESVDRVSAELGFSDDEASRLVAYYGRSVLGLPLATLAQALAFESPNALSAQLSRVRNRLRRSEEYRATVERVAYILGETPSPPVRNQTL